MQLSDRKRKIAICILSLASSYFFEGPISLASLTPNMAFKRHDDFSEEEEGFNAWNEEEEASKKRFFIAVRLSEPSTGVGGKTPKLKTANVGEVKEEEMISLGVEKPVAEAIFLPKNFPNLLLLGLGLKGSYTRDFGGRMGEMRPSLALSLAPP